MSFAHVFSALPSSVRAIAVDDYVRYVEARDGGITAHASGGDRREQRLSALLAGGLELVDAPAEIVDTIARLYDGESFALTILLADRRPSAAIAHITRQELSHTRILAALLAMAGRSTTPRPMPWLLRVLVRGLVLLPHPLSTMLLLIGELMGVLILLSVRGRLAQLFEAAGAESAGAKAAGASRAIELVDEILIDEVGHLAYNHARLSPWLLRIVAVIARLQLPLHARVEPLAAHAFGEASVGRFRWTMLPRKIILQAWAPALASVRQIPQMEHSLGLEI